MSQRPPALAIWLLLRLLPAHAAEAITGDLSEIYVEEVIPQRGRLRATLWYWKQTVRALLGVTASDATGPLGPIGGSKAGGIFPNFIADFRHAFRLIRKTPLFTITCVLLFGVGIGTNAIIILFLDSQVTHPLPGVPDVDSLVRIEFPRETRRPSEKQSTTGYLYADEWRSIEGSFQGVATVAASYTDRRVRLDDGHTVNPGRIEFVSPHYFEVLRPPMTIGPTPGLFNQDHAIVLSHAYWRSALLSDPDVLGRTITLNQVAYSVVGVTSRYFHGSRSGSLSPEEEPAGWIPISGFIEVSPYAKRRPQMVLTVPMNGIIGRLEGGASVERVNSQVHVLARNIHRSLHNPGVRYGYAYSVGTSMLARLGEMRKVIVALPLLVLIVACSNVSILLLGRGVTRRREIAVRLALGAGRRRVVRLLLVESVTLGTIGAGAGILFAYYGTQLLATQFPQTFGTNEIAIGWRTVLGALVLAVGTGVTFGVLPALHVTRTSLNSALKSADSGEGRQRSALQNFFVIMEMAVSMGMVCVTGLVLTHIYPAFVAPAGLDVSSQTMVTGLNFSGTQPTSTQTDAYLTAVRARLLLHPEVEAVSTVDRFPIGGSKYMTSPMSSGVSGSVDVLAGKVMIDPDYFAVMRIPLEGGRDFNGEDLSGSPPVVIVSRTIADRLWPGGSALGKTIRLTGTLPGETGSDTATHFFKVVGVASTHGLIDPDYMDGLVYFSRRQVDPPPAYLNGSLSLIIRTNIPGAPLITILQDEISRENPGVVISGLRSTAYRHNEVYAQHQVTATVGLIGGLITLLMACVGVYAVIAFSIGQRTREIGLRMALGARPGQVVRLFFTEGFYLAFCGLGLGVPMALAGVMVLEAGDKSPEFLGTFHVAGIILLLLAVAMLASWLPSRRAAQVDPMRALKSE